MNRIYSLKQNFFCLLFATLSMSCSGQSSSGISDLDPDKIMEVNYDNLIKALLEHCHESSENTKACEIALGKYNTLTLTEAYLQRVENDMSILQAGNQFDVRKAKEAMKSEEGRVDQILSGIDGSTYVAYEKKTLTTQQFGDARYDFDTESIILTIHTLNGRKYFGRQEEHIGLSLSISQPFQNPVVVEIPMSYNEAEKLFSDKYVKCITKITFGDLFEEGDRISKNVHGIIKKVELYNEATKSKIAEATL